MSSTIQASRLQYGMRSLWSQPRFGLLSSPIRTAAQHRRSVQTFLLRKSGLETRRLIFDLTDPSCHYGTRDLIILCRNGSVLLVQDYKSTLRLPSEERHLKIFSLTLPSNGPDYWNLAVEANQAYITSASRTTSFQARS